jgi:hypothetical protein
VVALLQREDGFMAPGVVATYKVQFSDGEEEAFGYASRDSNDIIRPRPRTTLPLQGVLASVVQPFADAMSSCWLHPR